MNYYSEYKDSLSNDQPPRLPDAVEHSHANEPFSKAFVSWKLSLKYVLDIDVLQLSHREIPRDGSSILRGAKLPRFCPDSDDSVSSHGDNIGSLLVQFREESLSRNSKRQ